jgi:hypothetical protein
MQEELQEQNEELNYLLCKYPRNAKGYRDQDQTNYLT